MNKLRYLAIFLLCACGGSSLLDQPFSNSQFLEHFNGMLKNKQVNREQAFLLQYALLRKNDRLDYNIEDKTYREIIELARTFEKSGMPVKENFIDNGQQSIFKASIINEGAGMIRKGNSSKLKKVLKFNVQFTNTSDKDAVLLSNTIIVIGPFKKHLTSAGYEVNCLVKAGEQINLNFMLDAINIKDNLLHDVKYNTESLMLDDLLSRIELKLGGVSVEQNTQHFESCGRNNARRAPFRVYEYAKDFKTDQVVKGEASERQINLGEMHFIVEESDEPIEMFR